MSKIEIGRDLPYNQYQAAINAYLPSKTNPFVTSQELLPYESYRGAWYDGNDQIPAAATPQAIKLGSPQIEVGVQVVNDLGGNPTRIQVTDAAGAYNLQFSVQLEKTGGTGDYIYFWIKKNGLDEAWSNTKVEMGNNNDFLVAAWNWVLDMGIGSYVEIWYACDLGNIKLSADPTPAYGPQVPSAIVTMCKI